VRCQQHPQLPTPVYRRHQAVAHTFVGPFAQFPAARAYPAPHPRAGLIDAGLRRGWAFDRAQPAQIVNIFRQMRFDVCRQRLGLGGFDHDQAPFCIAEL
jgi:hypothetical protein